MWWTGGKIVCTRIIHIYIYTYDIISVISYNIYFVNNLSTQSLKSSLRGTNHTSGVVVSRYASLGLRPSWEWDLKRFWGEKYLKYPAPRKVAQRVLEKLQFKVSISDLSGLPSPLQELFSAKQLHCFKLQCIHVAKSSYIVYLSLFGWLSWRSNP